MYYPMLRTEYRKLKPDASKALMAALLENITIDASDDADLTTPTKVKADIPAPMNGQEAKDKPYDPSTLFLLEMGTALAIRDKESMRNLSAKVAGYCTEILRQRKHLHPIQLERSLIYLLSLKKRGHETVHYPLPSNLQGVDTGISLTEVIRAVLSSPQPLFQTLSPSLTRSIFSLAQVDVALVLEDPRTLFQFLKKAILVPEAQASEFALCELLIDTDGARCINPKVYPLVINIFGDFATLGSVGAEWEQRNDVLQKRVKPSRTPDRPYNLVRRAYNSHSDQISRAKMAVELIYTLHKRAQTFIEESEDPASGSCSMDSLIVAWGVYFAPILESLTRQSINPCREVRTAALSLLQQFLLLPGVLPPQSPQTAYWPDIVFEKSLLHLINELLRPEVFASDKRGMGETRVIAQGLMCKIFLHCLGRLVDEDAANTEGNVVLTVWGGIVDVLIRLVGSGQKDVVVLLSGDLTDHQEEAVPESLKNVLLVMSAQGILVQPSLGGGEIWDLTWQKLDRALPKLRGEVFPGEVKRTKEFADTTAGKEQETENHDLESQKET